MIRSTMQEAPDIGLFSEVVSAQRHPSGLYDLQIKVDGEALVQIDGVAFASPSGSHLYGTADRESDFDLRGVYLAPLESIILGNARETVRATTSGDDVANQPGDFDAEFVELRKFLEDALAGQAYAVELLNVPDELALVSTDLWESLLDSPHALVSRRVEPFVGYCRAQAKKYADKRQRLRVIEETLEILEQAPRGERIERVADELPLDEPYLRLVEQPIRGTEQPVTLLDVAGKRFEMRAKIKKAVDSLRRLRDAYGERVRQSRHDRDWKAISHAYRIAFELRELLRTGGIEFPLEQADLIRRIKHGEVPYEQIQREIPKLVDEAIATPTELPDAPDTEAWHQWLVDQYRTRFCDT